MARRSKEQRKALVLKAYRLRTRGLSHSEISESLSKPVRRGDPPPDPVPRSTVTWLLKEGDRITNGELSRLTLRDIQHELYIQLQERRRAAWRVFTNTSQDAVKASCLEKMDQMDERLVELGRMLSIVPQKGQGPTVNVHIDNQLQNILSLPDDQLRAYAEREATELFGGAAGAAATNGH